MNSKTQCGVWVLVLAALLTAPAKAQEGMDPLAGSEVSSYLNTLTPEQIDELIAQANERRLAMERELTVTELRQDLWFDPEQVEEAAVLLTDDPATDRAGSVLRTMDALAIVDPQFARARQLLAEGNIEEAVALASKLVDANEASYLSAVRHLFYARALVQAGELEDATHAYKAILVNMTERMSLAATAAWEGAETFEEMGWYIDAGSWYAFLLKNYSLTLASEEYKTARDAYARHKAFVEDPLNAIAERMAMAGEDLRAGEPEESADDQQEVIKMIEDILRETQPAPNQPPRPPGENQPPPSGEEEESVSPSGEQTGNNQNRSTNPATSEHLPGDGVRRDPSRGTNVHDTEEHGDWASLPPREREKYQELVQRGMDDRHQEISREYHEELAEEGNE